MKKIKLLAGITQDDELYFLELENGKEHFSMSGFTVSPIKLEDAHDRVREGLQEGDMWREAVAHNQTELGLNEWIDYVIDTDGNLAGFDSSLFEDAVKVHGDKYIFESQACGQHEEKDLKNYFIDEKLFTELLKLWRIFHLRKLPKNSIAEDIYKWAVEVADKQDMHDLAEQAVRLINL